jgi:hypothetical protein
VSRPNLARKARRDAVRRARGHGKREKVDGVCDHKGCEASAKVKLECLTCEKAGKTVKTVRGCDSHALWAQGKLRSHALTAHPSNLIGAVVGQLAGKDVF